MTETYAPKRVRDKITASLAKLIARIVAEFARTAELEVLYLHNYMQMTQCHEPRCYEKSTTAQSMELPLSGSR
jgi:beta-xylosidase